VSHVVKGSTKDRRFDILGQVRISYRSPPAKRACLGTCLRDNSLGRRADDAADHDVTLLPLYTTHAYR